MIFLLLNLAQKITRIYKVAQTCSYKNIFKAHINIFHGIYHKDEIYKYVLPPPTPKD